MSAASVRSRGASEKPQFISDLSYPALKRLADRLDIADNWRRLVEAMPACPYDSLTVERFALNAHRKDGSPAYSLLTDMSNRGVGYEELVRLLKKLGFLQALVDLGYKEEARISTHPRSVPVLEGEGVVLECLGEGVPPPTYMWFKGREPLPDQRSSKLELNPVTREHAGHYICRAMNDYGTAFSNYAEVKVQTPMVTPAMTQCDERPVITTQPRPHTHLLVGQTLHLLTMATGHAHLHYQWFHNGSAMVYAVGAELVVPNVSAGVQGSYTCQVSDPRGMTILSETAIVTVAQGQGFAGHGLEYNTPPVVHETYEPPPFTPESSASWMTPGGQSFSHTPGGEVMVGQGVPAKEEYFTPVDAYDDDGPQGQDVVKEMADLSKPCYDKVALLIGNKLYDKASMQLNTPEHDTQDFAGILRSAGFKVVSLVNLNKQEMDEAVNYLTSLLGKNVYALFFFAGHGFRLGNQEYMMAVDASPDKDPSYCVCAQEVLDCMQGQGAKLSVVILDMCRMPAPAPSLSRRMDQESHSSRGAGYQPSVTHTGGFYVYGFSCSPNEKAFEKAGMGLLQGGEEWGKWQGKGGGGGEGGRGQQNSIFMSAIRKCFEEEEEKQERGGDEEEEVRHQRGEDSYERVDALLSRAAANVYEHWATQNQQSQQKPEIQSNLGQSLSLWDPILPHSTQENNTLRRIEAWKSAHTVPDPVVVSCVGGELAVRMHFEAEHSNVLVLTAELLNGCLAKAQILSMDVEILQDITAFTPLRGECVEGKEGHEKQKARKELVLFRIADIQKLRYPDVPVLLRVYGTHDCNGEKHYNIVKAIPPPLYSMFLHHSLPSPLPTSPGPSVVDSLSYTGHHQHQHPSPPHMHPEQAPPQCSHAPLPGPSTYHVHY